MTRCCMIVFFLFIIMRQNAVAEERIDMVTNPDSLKNINFAQYHSKETWILIKSRHAFIQGSSQNESARRLDEINDAGRRFDEIRHRVILTRNFEIQTTEVTQGQFLNLMGYNPSHFFSCGGDCPVENVSWHEAAAYCNKLSSEKGFVQCYSCSGIKESTRCSTNSSYSTPYDCLGYRLPTEAEWEYAARAGSTKATYNGDLLSGFLTCRQGNKILDPIAWFCGNSGAHTHPVAQKLPNSWGLFDMLGNVLEWNHDWFGTYPSGQVTDPWGSTSGSIRVLRGGSWLCYAQESRAAVRGYNSPDYHYNDIGFRPSRSIP